MSDFENELRSQLREAAGHAPVFSGATLDHKDRQPTSTAAEIGERKLRHPVRWLAAAAAVTIIAGGAGWTAGRDTGRTTEQASCPNEVVADGSVHVANGDLVRVPRPGPRLTGISVTRVPCGAALGDPGEPVTAFRVSGVDPAIGSLTVQMRVTSATDKGADPQFLRQALGNGERAQVEVDCDRSTFVATAFALR